MIVCKACGDECRVVTVDFGIGSYEYWGAPGFDSRPADVSECCEADFEEKDDAPDPDRYVSEEEFAPTRE